MNCRQLLQNLMVFGSKRVTGREAATLVETLPRSNPDPLALTIPLAILATAQCEVARPQFLVGRFGVLATQKTIQAIKFIRSLSFLLLFIYLGRRFGRMLGQSGRLGRSPGGSNAFPGNFYNALNRGDGETAMLLIREESGMPDGTPSPRAQELLDMGEWDAKRRESLRLGRVNCAGSISGDVKRFCGKLECTILSHRKAGGVEPGWYMTAAPKCYMASPVLPTESNGGPIYSGGAALLSQTAKPFELSKGQWRFVMEAWLADSHTVEFLESDDQEDGNEVENSLDDRWNMPDLGTSDLGREEDDDRREVYEPTDTGPRLTVRTCTDVHDEADAAADLVAMMHRVMREVDACKSREQDLTSQLRLVRTEQTGMAGDLSRAHQEINHLKSHVGRLIGRVQLAEETAGSPSARV
jgi:hypothetical protein